MKKYAYLLWCLAMVACKHSDGPISSNYAIVAGKVSSEIENSEIRFNHEAVALSTDENGNFRDTIAISSPQYVHLSFGDFSARIYLTQGDEVNITVDSVLSFSGSNADINTYLQAYAQNDRERQAWEYRRHEQTFTQNEVDYVNFRDSIRTQKLAQLQKLPAGTAAFQDFHQKDIDFQYQYDVARYPNYYSYFVKDYEPTAIITAFYEGVDLDNEAYAQNYAGYRALVDLVFEKQIQALIETGLRPLEAHLAVLEDIQSPTILHRRLNRALYFYTFETKDVKATKSKMLALAKQDRTKTVITQHYEVINRLKPNSPAPPFDLENHQGGNTTLTDLKGKYVYIDVWATWCGPCLKEMPYLKEMEKEFEHSNITFVSISLDEPRFYEQWRAMVETEEFGGVQLIVENGWDSDFVSDYGIQALPRFVLLDEQGHFISADVEKPSDPKLKARLRSLGI